MEVSEVQVVELSKVQVVEVSERSSSGGGVKEFKWWTRLTLVRVCHHRCTVPAAPPGCSRRRGRAPTPRSPCPANLQRPCALENTSPRCAAQAGGEGSLGLCLWWCLENIESNSLSIMYIYSLKALYKNEKIK